MTTETTTKILIADDHSLLRAGLRDLIDGEEGLIVAGEAATGEEALRETEALRPELILLDLSMPGPGGVELTRQLRQLFPQTRVLILTVHEDEGLLREAIQAGAAGYIVKRAAESELINAIHAVLRDELYIHPSLSRALFDEGSQHPPSSQPARGLLTPAELDLLRRLARGYTNHQIANELGLSVRAVETHRANLMAKLDLHTRVELVRWATENQLLS